MPEITTETSVKEAKNAIPRVGREKAKDAFAVTIRRKPQEVYAFWRDLKNLCLFMKDIDDIQVLSPTESKWIVRTEGGKHFEWEARIVGDIPGEWLAWESKDGADIETAGAVFFEEAPAGRGTVVKMAMSYKIPGGKLTELAAKFTGEDPHNLTLTNLKRLKAYLETGEIPTTEGQPSGRGKPYDVREDLH